MTPGNRQRRARMQHGYSLRQLEARTEKLGHRISRTTLSNLERDTCTRLDITQITTLCRALHMSADWWIMGNQQPPDAIGSQARQLSERDREQLRGIVDALTRLAEQA